MLTDESRKAITDAIGKMNISELNQVDALVRFATGLHMIPLTEVKHTEQVLKKLGNPNEWDVITLTSNHVQARLEAFQKAVDALSSLKAAIRDELSTKPSGDPVPKDEPTSPQDSGQ